MIDAQYSYNYTVNDKEARHGTFISCTAVVSCGCTYTAQNAVQQTLQGGQGTDIIGGTEKWSANLKQWCWELSLRVEVGCKLAVNRQGNVASTCMLLFACKTIKHVETFRTTCDIC